MTPEQKRVRLATINAKRPASFVRDLTARLKANGSPIAYGRIYHILTGKQKRWIDRSDLILSASEGLLNERGIIIK